jgi:hypothetical protein
MAEVMHRFEKHNISIYRDKGKIGAVLPKQVQQFEVLWGLSVIDPNFFWIYS